MFAGGYIVRFAGLDTAAVGLVAFVLATTAVAFAVARFAAVRN